MNTVPLFPDPKTAPAISTFETFWEMYPRKIAKGSARKKWAQLTYADQQLILEHLPKRIETDAQWQTKTYIPHPTTFINQERWTDEYEAIEKPKARLAQYKQFAPEVEMSAETRAESLAAMKRMGDTFRGRR